MAVDFKSWIESRFGSPLCLVASSTVAEEVCGKNGLSALHLLNPFCRSTQDITRSFRETDVSPVRNFSIRLTRADCVRELEPRQRVEHFTRMLNDLEPQFQMDVSAIGAIIDEIGVDTLDLAYPSMSGASATLLLNKSFPTWHTAFVQDYISMVRCSYFDTIDHPVGIINVIAVHDGSAHDKSITAQLKQIAGAGPQSRTGMKGMDDAICTFYVLLWDASIPQEVAQAQLKELTAQVSSDCAILKINSRKEAQPAPSTEIFERASRPVDAYATDGSGRFYDLPSTGRLVYGAPSGHCLNNTDINQIQSIMQIFMSRVIVPFLERRLHDVAIQVNDKRQTAFSKVAAWFRSAPQQQHSKPQFVAPPSGTGDAHYVHDSLEMQMRRCGDFSFFLQSYEAAQAFYRMAREEWQQTLVERPFNRSYIAAAQEALGMCHVVLGRLPLPAGDRRESENKFETARDLYVESRVFSYSFRISLMMFLFCRYRSVPANDKAAIVVLKAIPGVRTNALYISVLYEMLAVCFLVLHPPVPGNTPMSTVPLEAPLRCSLRKYAVCLRIAAERYMEGDYVVQAWKCYSLASRAYKILGGGNWPAIVEHSNGALSRLWKMMKNPMRALGYLGAAIRPDAPLHSKPETAFAALESYLCEITSFVSSFGIKCIPYMSVPLVDPVLFVQLNDFSTDEVTQQHEEKLDKRLHAEWGQLEDAMKTNLAQQHRLAMLPKPSGLHIVGGTHKSDPITSSVGEVITVRIKLTNQLGIPITLNDVSLLILEDSVDPAVSLGNNTSELCIEAASTVVVGLSFSPVNEGVFRIVGIVWKINGVEGRFPLALCSLPAYQHSPETLLEASHNMALDSLTDFPSCPKIIVEGQPARMVISISPPLPKEMRNGQVHRATLVVRNTSVASEMGGIVLQVSACSLHLICFGKENDIINDGGTVDLCGLTLPPRDEHRIPFVFRAQCQIDTEPCVNHVVILAAYTTQQSQRAASPVLPGSDKRMKMHAHRFVRGISVRCSITVSSVAIPPMSLSTGHVASLTIANLSAKSDSPLRICRIAAVGIGWSVKTASPVQHKSDDDEEGLDWWLFHGQRIAFPIEVYRNGVGKHSDEQEFVCLPFETTLPASRAAACRECVGSTVLHSAESWHFVRTAVRHCDRSVGWMQGEEDFVFYLDSRQKYKLQEKTVEAGNFVPFVPIVVAVAWCVDEHGSIRFGQHLHYVDVRCAQSLGHTPIQSDPKPADLAEAVVQRQTLSSHVGIVTVVPNTPASISAVLGHCRTAQVSILLRVQNFTPVPVNVDISCHNLLESSRPFAFCGRSKAHVSELLPDEQRVASFQVQVSAPGVHNLSSFEITASVTRKRSAVERVVVVGAKTPCVCTVTHDPHGIVAAASPSPSRPGGRARTLSSTNLSERVPPKPAPPTAQPVAVKSVDREESTSSEEYTEGLQMPMSPLASPRSADAIGLADDNASSETEEQTDQNEITDGNQQTPDKEVPTVHTGSEVKAQVGQPNAEQEKRDEEAARKKAEEEEAARKTAEQEEAARKKAEEQEEAARKKAEEEEAARKTAEQEEAARKKAEEQEEAARKKAEEEEAARKTAEQEEAARKKAEEEEAARKTAEQEEAARKKAEEEEAARRMAEENVVRRQCESEVQKEHGTGVAQTDPERRKFGVFDAELSSGEEEAVIRRIRSRGALPSPGQRQARRASPQESSSDSSEHDD